MEWFNSNTGIAQWITLVITVIIGILAFSIGSTQNEINRTIQKLQDSVELYAYPVINPQLQRIFLRLTNVGSVQLYLTSYVVNGGPDQTLGRSLIPASQQQNAWFDILISPSTDTSAKKVVIELEDGLNRKWVSTVAMTFDNGSWVTAVSRIIQK